MCIYPEALAEGLYAYYPCMPIRIPFQNLYNEFIILQEIFQSEKMSLIFFNLVLARISVLRLFLLREPQLRDCTEISRTFPITVFGQGHLLTVAIFTVSIG